jgi:hypothetical protein
MIVQKATPMDVFDVAYRMRKKDFEEISATSGSDDRKKVAARMQMGFENYYTDGWVVLDDKGKRVSIIGWTRYPDKLTRARVGFFGTDDFEQMKMAITKLIRGKIDLWAQDVNVVRMDAQSLDGYEDSHKWLEFFGFKRGDVLINWKDSGRTFINFEKQINIL